MLDRIMQFLVKMFPLVFLKKDKHSIGSCLSIYESVRLDISQMVLTRFLVKVPQEYKGDIARF